MWTLAFELKDLISSVRYEHTIYRFVDLLEIWKSFVKISNNDKELSFTHRISKLWISLTYCVFSVSGKNSRIPKSIQYVWGWKNKSLDSINRKLWRIKDRPSQNRNKNQIWEKLLPMCVCEGLKRHFSKPQSNWKKRRKVSSTESFVQPFCNLHTSSSFQKNLSMEPSSFVTLRDEKSIPITFHGDASWISRPRGKISVWVVVNVRPWTVYRATPTAYIWNLFLDSWCAPGKAGGSSVKQVAIATHGYGCLEPSYESSSSVYKASRHVFSLVIPIPGHSKAVSSIDRGLVSLSIDEIRR